MATTTENLGLTLPAGTDRAEISVLNENFQTLDAFAGQATADIQQAQETANAAAPQATTYTKDEVDSRLQVSQFDTTTYSSLAAYVDTLGNGTYTFLVPNNNTLTDVPMNNSPAIITVKKYSANSAVLDFVAPSTTYQMYRYSKIKSGGMWRDWYRFEGTAVTSVT